MENLKKGSTGADVAKLQQLLGIEAEFGDRTFQALKAWQKAHGLDADGIAGPKTLRALGMIEDIATADPAENIPDTQPEEKLQPVDYKQYDSRWKSIAYTTTSSKTQTIGSSGCGPTSMADIMATVVDSAITPAGMASQFLKAGFRTSNQGTSWGAFKWTAEKFDFRSFAQTTDINILRKYLNNGGYAVASMGPGYWTSGGHYICVWRMDDTYIYANDPASASRTKQKIETFRKECKQLFCFIK